MKITKRQLRRIITEELAEAFRFPPPPQDWPKMAKAKWKKYQEKKQAQVDGDEQEPEDDGLLSLEDRIALADEIMGVDPNIRREKLKYKESNLRLTKRQLRRIIREERVRLLYEAALPQVEFIGWNNEYDQTALGWEVDGVEYQMYQSGNVNEEYVAEDLLNMWLEDQGLDSSTMDGEEYNNLLDGMIATVKANPVFAKDQPVMNQLMSAMAQGR
jgi:hypothetical protein